MAELRPGRRRDRQRTYAGVGIRGAAGADASESDELKPGERVNINTASRAELEKLPGIGEKLAGSIIEYRTANGPFKTADGLMNVPGIGQAKFDAVKGSIKT